MKTLRWIQLVLPLFAAMAVVWAAPHEETTLSVKPVPLPGGAGGIGFDDMIFSPALGKVVVPAGRSGSLDLIDPKTAEVEPIGGFSASERFAGGHGAGTTSADVGRGMIVTADRTTKRLMAVDAGTRKIVASATMASGSDYVRFVEPTGEIWVTEPDADQIEIFSMAAGSQTLRHEALLPVPGGPESLVIDVARERGYANLWKGSTIAIDLRKRTIAGSWSNGCEGSRGLALDPRRGFLFVGCAEGKAVVLLMDGKGKDGSVIDSLKQGDGVDIIAYSQELSHLYLPGARSATMAILGVASNGKLGLLGTVKTAAGAHCVVADDARQAWVCDPDHGQLLLMRDTLPPAGE